MTNTDIIENVMDRLGKVFLSSCHGSGHTVITLEEFLSDEVLRNDIQSFLRVGWLPDEIFKYMSTWEDVCGYMDENKRDRKQKAIELKVIERMLNSATVQLILLS